MRKTSGKKRPGNLIYWGACLLLLAAVFYAAFVLFYPGAVFILAVILEVLLLAVAAAVFMLWRTGRKWWTAGVCLSAALFLVVLVGGGMRVSQALNWINQDPDIYSDGRVVPGRADGTVELDPSIVQKGGYVSLNLTYLAGSEGIAPGGGVILRLGEVIPLRGGPAFYDCTYQDMFQQALQVGDPKGQGWAGASAPPGVKLALSKPDAPNPGDFLLNTMVANLGSLRRDATRPNYYPLNAAHRHELHLKVVQGRIAPGDRIVLTLGDTSQGSPGWRMPGGEAGACLAIYVDAAGDGQYRFCGYAPLEVCGGDAAALQVIAPSTPTLDQNFTFVVKAVDQGGALSMLHSGGVSILTAPGVSVAQPAHLFTPADRGVHDFTARVSLPGTYRIAVRDDRTGEVYYSNPLMASAVPGRHIYWGDLHQHTTLGKDANRTPAWVFQRNRDVDLMDFAAISIHDLFEYWGLPPSPDEIDYLHSVNRSNNQDGSFVTFDAYEWTNLKAGHRNIYFAGEGEPVVIPYNVAQDPSALREDLQGADYICIPHHTAWRFLHSRIPFDWGPRDWEQARLVEVYSKHGSSEYYDSPYPIHRDFTPFFVYLLGGSGNRAPRGDGSYVREALAEGYRLGITAGGDNHWAVGGTSFGSNITRDYAPGLQAVYSEELTRGALYRSMWQRRTYGTTGARIIIDFSVNGSPMGSEIACEGRPPTIRYMVKGTGNVSRVEIWKHSGSKGWEMFDRGGGAMDLEGEFSDSSFHEDSLYFLRIEQQDGNLGWSSPVWVLK